MRAARCEGICRIGSVIAIALLFAGCATNEGESDARNGVTARDASSPGSDATGGSSGATRDASGTASGGSGGDTGTLPYPVGKCPEGLPGPSLVNVPAPNGATYCIDATEVTRGHYQEFIEARYTKQFVQAAPKCDGGFLEGTERSCDVVVPSCEGNVYEPTERLTSVVDGRDLGCTWWLEGKDDYPINCVDWCDAAGYCEWAGKRLCGNAGGMGEFNRACRGGWLGGPDFPESSWISGTYAGPDYKDLAACNFDEGDAYDGLAPVGAMKGCEGGYPGLFDLKGNVFELVDAPYGCCNAFGGAFNSKDIIGPYLGPTVDCGAVLGVDTTTPRHDIGFRCCADALPETP